MSMLDGHALLSIPDYIIYYLYKYLYIYIYIIYLYYIARRYFMLYCLLYIILYHFKGCLEVVQRLLKERVSVHTVVKAALRRQGVKYCLVLLGPARYGLLLPIIAQCCPRD